MYEQADFGRLRSGDSHHDDGLERQVKAKSGGREKKGSRCNCISKNPQSAYPVVWKKRPEKKPPKWTNQAGCIVPMALVHVCTYSVDRPGALQGLTRGEDWPDRPSMTCVCLLVEMLSHAMPPLGKTKKHYDRMASGSSSRVV